MRSVREGQAVDAEMVAAGGQPPQPGPHNLPGQAQPSESPPHPSCVCPVFPGLLVVFSFKPESENRSMWR